MHKLGFRLYGFGLQGLVMLICRTSRHGGIVSTTPEESGLGLEQGFYPMSTWSQRLSKLDLTKPHSYCGCQAAKPSTSPKPPLTSYNNPKP